MQPFDALTVRAVLSEAKPLLINRKVDKVHQLGRDEIIIALRSKGGISHLLLSAHASFGRLCLVKMPTFTPRSNVPAFGTLLRKHLTGATLVGVEQLLGERIVDLVFSCQNEVGATSLKVLTAEIMGRHSNLIFWDKQDDKILCASHLVTREMSRQREIAPGLTYVRPPRQDKTNIFKVTESEFLERASGLAADLSSSELEQWLTVNFAGLGRHLAEEFVVRFSSLQAAPGRWPDEAGVRLWQAVAAVQQTSDYRPTMRVDLTRYTVLSWLPGVDNADDWKRFPSVNDLVEEYYRAQEQRERFQQLKERLVCEIRSEYERLDKRLKTAESQLGEAVDFFRLRRFGDLILSNINQIAPGQTELICEDLCEGDGREVRIQLNANLTGSQNAQQYYRQFAKARARSAAAQAAKLDASARLSVLRERLADLEAAATTEELEKVKESVIGRPRPEPSRAPARKPPGKRLLSIHSSDGWTIFAGRNRKENDELISRLAAPQDIWMHVLGAGGAHVLIKVPSIKREPPAATLAEAAQLAARLSKAAPGGKVRVVYTQCRYVKKMPGGKAGVVQYQNEKTVEVDTSLPMPAPLKQLFAPNKQEKRR